MSELAAPRIETAPVEGSLRARMLGKAASVLGRMAERIEASAARSGYEPAHTTQNAATIDHASDISTVDTAAQTAGYDLKSADATAALESIVARQKQADQRQLYGLQREVNSRAARKDRRNPAYAATERSLIDTDEVSGDETTTTLPELFDGIDSTAGYDLRSEAAKEALDSIVARQERTENRRAQGLSGEENDRAARIQRKNAAKAKKEAAYAARESAQLGTDIEHSTSGVPAVETRKTKKAEAASNKQASAEYVGRHAKKINTAGSHAETPGFEWIADAQAAGFTREPKPEVTDSQPEQSSAPSLAEVFRHPSVLGMFMGAEAHAKLVETVRKRRMANETKERREISDRTKFVVAAGTIGVALTIGITRAYLTLRGNDTSALDAAAFDLQPITPIDGGSETAEQLSQVAPFDTTPASELASQTAETTASSGGGSRAGGSGGSAETVGALGGEAIDPTAWNVPKGSGGEQLIQRLGSDRATWYENQDAFLKQFPNEAYRMNDGNVGLRPGRLSQGAIDFWTKAISK